MISFENIDNFGISHGMSKHDLPIFDIVHNLPIQSKLVLLSILLQDKYNKKIDTSKKIVVSDVYEIYKELCKKTGKSCINKRKIKNSIYKLCDLGLIEKENIII